MAALINPIDAYAHAGRKAGEAQNYQDAACVRSWREHFQRMRDLERDQADQRWVSEVYADAYRAARRL